MKYLSIIFCTILFARAAEASVVPAWVTDRWYDRIDRIENRAIDDAIIEWGRVGEKVDRNNSFSIDAPILTYHQVREVHSDDPRARRRFITSPNELDAQLSEIEKEGFTVVTLDDLADHLSSRGSYAKGTRPIVLTFDDGFKNQYINALPILRKHKMVATFFVCPGITGKESDTMNWNDILSLERSGMTIGNHTSHHVMLTGNISTSTRTLEIVGAGSELATHLGHPVTLFAYPYGKYDGASEDLIKKSGYHAAVSVDVGHAQTPSRLFTLKRFDIGNDHSVFEKAIKK